MKIEFAVNVACLILVIYLCLRPNLSGGHRVESAKARALTVVQPLSSIRPTTATTPKPTPMITQKIIPLFVDEFKAVKRNCTHYYRGWAAGLNSQIIVEVSRVIHAHLSNCYYCAGQDGSGPQLFGDAYSQVLCAEREQQMFVSQAVFFDSMRTYCDQKRQSADRMSYFQCVRHVYRGLILNSGRQQWLEELALLDKDSSGREPVYFHLRLGDERTDKRAQFVPPMSDEEYAELVAKAMRWRSNSTALISSRDHDRAENIVQLVNSKRVHAGGQELRFHATLLKHDIGNLQMQTRFFETLARRKVLTFGSVSSNFETIMMLHRDSATQDFIELHRGYFWNFDGYNRNVYADT